MAPLTLFAGALAVRLLALGVAHATGRFPEFWEYETIARNLLAGHGFVYTHMGLERSAYVEPLYPFLVAGVYLVTGAGLWWLAAVQAVASAALAPVTYAFAARTFGPRAGIAAGALVAIDPGLVGYATKFHPLTFDALAIAVVGLALLALLDAPGWPRAALFGVALGACVLTRPTIAAVVPVVVVWLLWRRDRRRVVTHVVAGTVIAALIVAPWVVRNYLALDALVLTRSHLGFGFWLGNHPGAAGGEGDPADPTGDRSAFERASPELRARVFAARDEIAQDRIFRAEALRYVADEPLAFVARTLRKLGYFFWFPPYLGRRYPPAATAVYSAFYVVASMLALAGLWLTWRRPLAGQAHGVRIALLLVLTIALAQAVFYVQGRHRLGVEALILVFSGRALAMPGAARAG